VHRGIARAFAVAAPKVDDAIVVAGDLVDRGPDSPAVVRFFRELSLVQRVILVCGNHEYKHGRYRRNLIKQPRVARDMIQHNSELQTITEQLSELDVSFLDSAKLLYHVPDTDIVVLHAGVTPNMRSLPKDTGSWSKYDAQIMYVRHVDPAGNMVRLGAERPDCRFWADVYDGRFGHIFFDHEPFVREQKPVQFPHATGLDLGCVFGGHLACARYEAGDIRYFTVKARTSYSKSRTSMEEM
jgi:hypothetical protein